VTSERGLTLACRGHGACEALAELCGAEALVCFILHMVINITIA
jgi:hypothetical protein